MPDFLKTSFLFLPIFILSLGIGGCGSAKNSKNQLMFEENPPFAIEEAYFQKWVAGIKEGGAGIKAHIVFSSMEPNVVVREIFFQNKVLQAKKSINNPKEYVGEFSNNSRKDIIMDIDPMKEAQNTPSQNFPFELKENEAVIGYLFGGKTNYFKIHNLSEKERIAYPQSNPNNRN